MHRALHMIFRQCYFHRIQAVLFLGGAPLKFNYAKKSVMKCILFKQAQIHTLMIHASRLANEMSTPETHFAHNFEPFKNAHVTYPACIRRYTSRIYYVERTQW